MVASISNSGEIPEVSNNLFSLTPDSKSATYSVLPQEEQNHIEQCGDQKHRLSKRLLTVGNKMMVAGGERYRIYG